MNNQLVGINTNRPISLVKEAIQNGRIKELQNYNNLKTEVNYGKNSRLDFLLSNENDECFVEVKNVTLVKNNIALFPDAVTSRGTKHLNELLEIVKSGNRGVVCFVIQRTDATEFKPAQDIDPVFAQTLKHVFSQGVQILAYQASISITKINIDNQIPISFS